MTQSQTVAIGRRIIGPGENTFVIAELGSNHDGKLEQAVRLLEVAAEAGCDAVKLQIPIADECYPPKTRFGGIYGDRDIADVIRGNEIPRDWVPRLVEKGHELGLLIGASTDGFIGLEIMLAGGVDFIKIPSFTISHIPLLRACGASGVPVLFSTGVHSFGGVEEAIAAVAPVVPGIFHCISSYPAPLDSLNLRTLPFLRDAFGIPVGFSDHSTDPVAAPRLAVALGATMIEKHYTLDRTLPGTDHFFAVEPDELTAMVRAIRAVAADAELAARVVAEPASQPMLGQVRRGIFAAEEPFSKRTRLGLYFRRALAAGETVGPEDVRVYRCADTEPGLHPRFLDLVRGARVVRAAQAYEPVEWNHLLDRAR